MAHLRIPFVPYFVPIAGGFVLPAKIGHFLMLGNHHVYGLQWNSTQSVVILCKTKIDEF
jgi:hypothetical protein